MSAPLVVNTTDGTVWLRRASTRGGLELYAPADVCVCPEFVMATLAELAEHGIAGSADVLPVPVGPEPQASADADRAKAPWGRGEDGRPLLPMGVHWTDIPELVDQEVARIRGRVDEAQSGRWYMAPATEMGLAPGTVRTTVDGYQRTVGQFANVLPGDRELVLHAHDDLSWCLEMIAKFRARVAELEAERHSTNEALDDAVQTLREKEKREAVVSEFVAARAEYITSIRNCHPDNGHDYDRWQGHAAARRQLAELLGLPVAWPEGPTPDESAAKLAAILAPSEGGGE